MKTLTALGSGTVPLPPDPPRMTVWGMRVGESRTVKIGDMVITESVGEWHGMRFIANKKIPAGHVRMEPR